MNEPLLSPRLLEWIVMQNERLTATDAERIPAEPRERVFWQLAKLTEETGELADAVLALHGLQRAEKLPANAKSEVAAECADVILVTLLLAERLGIDIKSALERKIEKINARYDQA